MVLVLHNFFTFLKDRLCNRRLHRRLPLVPRPAQERKVLPVTLDLADSSQSDGDDELDIANDDLERGPLLGGPSDTAVEMTVREVLPSIPESEVLRGASNPGILSEERERVTSESSTSLATLELALSSLPPGLESTAIGTLREAYRDVPESKFLSAALRAVMGRRYDPLEPDVLPEFSSDLPLRKLHPGLESATLRILRMKCRLSQVDAIKILNIFKGLGYIEVGPNYYQDDNTVSSLPVGDQSHLASTTFLEVFFSKSQSPRHTRLSHAINYNLAEAFLERNLYPYLYLHPSAEVRSAGQRMTGRPPLGENGGLSPHYQPSRENNSLRRVLGIGSRAEHNYGKQSPFPEGLAPEGYTHPAIGLIDFSRKPSLYPVTVAYRPGVGPVIRTTRYANHAEFASNMRLNQHYPGAGGIEFPVTNGILQMLVCDRYPPDRGCVMVEAAILRTLPDQKGNPTPRCPEIMIPTGLITQKPFYRGGQVTHYFKQIGVKIDGKTYTRFLRVNINVPNRAYEQDDLRNLSGMQILIDLDTAPELRQRWQAIRLRQPQGLFWFDPIRPWNAYDLAYVFPHLKSLATVRPCSIPTAPGLIPALDRGFTTLTLAYRRYVRLPVRTSLEMAAIYWHFRRRADWPQRDFHLRQCQDTYWATVEAIHRFHNPPAPEQDRYVRCPL